MKAALPRWKASLVLCALALSGLVARAQVSDLQFRDPTIDDLCDILDVRVYAGSVRFDKPYGEISLVVEGYVKDQLIFSAASGHVVAQPGEINYPPGVCEFRVAIIDLDVIHLRGGKPNNCRILVGFRAKGATGSTAPTDIPKDKLDLTTLGGPEPSFNWRGGSALAADSPGRTLLFTLPGRASMQSTGTEAKPAVKIEQSNVSLKCYFLAK